MHPGMGMGTQQLAPGMIPMMGATQQIYPLQEFNDLNRNVKRKAKLDLKTIERNVGSLEQKVESLVWDNKLLENKCEEYLSQLQRSADIIEGAKERHTIQIEAYEDKIIELQELLDCEKSASSKLESEIDKLIMINQKSNMSSQKEQVELGSMIQEARQQKLQLEKLVEDRNSDLDEMREELRMMTLQKDGLSRQNQDLLRENEELKTKLEVEQEKSTRIEKDNRNLKEDYHDLRSENMRFESQNRNLLDRIGDKDRELQRMETELELLQKMVTTISGSHNTQKAPVLEQYNARDSAERYKRQSRNYDKVNSSVIEPKKTRFNAFQYENHNSGALQDSPKIDKMQNYSYDQSASNQKLNASRIRPNHEDSQLTRQGVKSRFNNSDQPSSKPTVQKTAEKPANQQSNILTWDQPYDKKRDHQEMKYESKEERRRKINMNHNEDQGSSELRKSG